VLCYLKLVCKYILFLSLIVNLKLTLLGTPMSPLVLAADEDWSLAMPLWLPYVIFTVVLLSLIVVSFARFHALRGAQYRNRQLADERSMGVNGAKNGCVNREDISYSKGQDFVDRLCKHVHRQSSHCNLTVVFFYLSKNMDRWSRISHLS